MNNQSKIYLSLIFLLNLFAHAVFAQNSITIFNTLISINASKLTSEFPSGYPLSIGASHLNHIEYNSLSTAAMRDVFNAARNKMNETQIPDGIPVLGKFFTTQYNGLSDFISYDSTHALCFGFQKNNSIILCYFEIGQAGKFNHISALDTRINALPDDLFISLHYANFSPGSFPDKSTVYSFIGDTLGYADVSDSADMIVALSRDYQRLTGLFPRGMADSLVLTGCDQPNGGYSKCGGKCQQSLPNTHCTYVMDSHGNGSEQCVSGNDRCAAGAIERRVHESNLDIGVPIKFKMMRDFRDKFMASYCEGRKYTGFYYIFSKYAKMDISMLWKYASVLPELYAAMENLTDESTDNIVITPALKEKVLEILQDHKDEGDSYFRSVLNEVAADMEAYEGLKRSELISLLTPYGNCSGERKTIAGQEHSNSFFASAYYNPGHDEIVVNYAVSGSRIKFELFSSSSGLVSEEVNMLSRQKRSISALHLKQGIYYYRISSDSGYEKVGKVAVIK